MKLISLVRHPRNSQALRRRLDGGAARVRGTRRAIHQGYRRKAEHRHRHPRGRESALPSVLRLVQHQPSALWHRTDYARIFPLRLTCGRNDQAQRRVALRLRGKPGTIQELVPTAPIVPAAVWINPPSTEPIVLEITGQTPLNPKQEVSQIH